MSDLLIFHWSPTVRRKQILRYGLRPNCRSTTNVAWKAPYVAFATSPSLAWSLSGDLRPDIESWDLWQAWTSRFSGYERLSFNEDTQAEIRVYERCFKRDIWYVGTRVGRKTA